MKKLLIFEQFPAFNHFMWKNVLVESAYGLGFRCAFGFQYYLVR